VRPVQPPVQGVPGSFSSGVRRLVCEADHSPSTRAEIKKRWIYIYTHSHSVVLKLVKQRDKYYTEAVAVF
jgi:hypothetical protein